MYRSIGYLLGLTMLVYCHQPEKESDKNYYQTLNQWRADRTAKLNQPMGWRSLVGLYRLPGEDLRLGTGTDCDIKLPVGFPEDFARLHIDGDQVRMESKYSVQFDGKMSPSADLTPTGRSNAPTQIAYEHFQMIVLDRAGEFFLRLWDTQKVEDHPLDSVPHFPNDIRWRVDAHLSHETKGDTVWIKNILGQNVSYVSEGSLVFTIDQKEYKLVAFGGSDTYFVLMSDETTSAETYGGGRYLYVPKVDGRGNTIIDFNKAENPPCVFTDFATCPLPPRENHLDVAITAGEMALPTH
ncbi:MAG: DUF1684 domain-containing protein [Saprospiraceae bacterium]|nr:DUF1684 domain-containing protein [Saprospiraceae bacterium]